VGQLLRRGTCHYWILAAPMIGLQGSGQVLINPKQDSREYRHGLDLESDTAPLRRVEQFLNIG
jgi:hypothetical protein